MLLRQISLPVKIYVNVHGICCHQHILLPVSIYADVHGTDCQQLAEQKLNLRDDNDDDDDDNIMIIIIIFIETC